MIDFRKERTQAVLRHEVRAEPPGVCVLQDELHVEEPSEVLPSIDLPVGRLKRLHEFAPVDAEDEHDVLNVEDVLDPLQQLDSERGAATVELVDDEDQRLVGLRADLGGEVGEVLLEFVFGRSLLQVIGKVARRRLLAALDVRERDSGRRYRGRGSDGVHEGCDQPAQLADLRPVGALLEVSRELPGNRDQRILREVVLPGVVVDRLPALIFKILLPALEQERLPRPPPTVEADDERRLLPSDDACQAVRDLLAVEHVVAPRVLWVVILLLDLE